MRAINYSVPGDVMIFGVFNFGEVVNMESNGKETPEARGEAAHKTIRKHFPTLMKIVATGDIVENLYAEEIIEESTFEIVTAINATMSNKQKGTKILKDVQIVVHSKPEHFETFCKVLEAEKNHTDAVQNLKGKGSL